MIRIGAALLLAASLSGCLAALAAPRRDPAPAGPLVHGFGENPSWAVDIFEESIVFFSGGQSITIDTPPSFTTVDGHRWESERLVIDVSHAPCRLSADGWEYPESVNVTADGRAYRGCGREARHDD